MGFFLFSFIGNNHALSIFLIGIFIGFSFWKFRNLKQGSINSLAFILVHEILFSVFILLPLVYLLGIVFLFVGCFVTWELITWKFGFTLRQFSEITFPFLAYLTAWFLLGFHLTHNVWTGGPTQYLNDPLTNAIEIGSWAFLCLNWICIQRKVEPLKKAVLIERSI